MNKSTVGELIIDDESCQYGLGLPAEEYTPNKVRYLRISDLDDSGNLLDDDKKSISAPNIQEYILKPNDLVVARTGNSTGRTYVYSEDDEKLAYAGFLIKYVFDSEKINPRYMKYFTISNIYKKQISGFSGSTRGNMNAQNFKDITVIYPDRKIQDKMVKLFDLISKKIKNNNKIISELESMTKTIYDYWFLQFEFPNEDGKPYKSSGGKMVWNDELKREIPEGWKVEPLFQCMDVTYGYPLSTNFFNQEEGTPVIRIRDILDNSTSAYTTEKIPDKYISESKDLLVGMDGNFHMNYCCEDGQYINQRIVRIREKDNISTMQVCFEIAPYIKKKEQNVARSTVGHLSDKDLKSIYILNSNNIHIYKVFNGFLEKICTARKENKKLTALRDFLLPMLMNGQVTFKEDE